MKTRIDCYTFSSESCCGSCHDDIEYGYELSDDDGKDFTIYRCCQFPSPETAETLDEYVIRLKSLGIEKSINN